MKVDIWNISISHYSYIKNRLCWENFHNTDTDGAENYEVFLCNDVTLLDAVRTLGANQTEQVTTLTSDTNCQTQGTRGPGSFADNEKDCRAIENFMHSPDTSKTKQSV